jgi:peptide/nickel transport system permease protein
MHLAPGDPVNLFANPNLDPAELVRIKANFGLDKPIIIQYFYWLLNVMRGDFGFSYQDFRPVLTVILERVPATLLLMLTVYIITLLITIPMGVFSAIKKNSWFDNFATFFSFLGMSIPSFWLALMLMLFFSLYLGWLPATGMTNPLIRDSSFVVRVLDIARHMVLPVTVMVIGGLAGLSRYQRASMLEVISQDYIRTARAKGLPERTVIFKHALRNAFLPIITILGLSLPDLFGGAFIIETIFGWPGMGRLGVQAVFARNYPIVMGVVMMSAVLIIIGNLLADLAYSWVDPRIRYKKINN